MMPERRAMCIDQRLLNARRLQPIGIWTRSILIYQFLTSTRSALKESTWAYAK